jgi:hypothetical protein
MIESAGVFVSNNYLIASDNASAALTSGTAVGIVMYKQTFVHVLADLPQAGGLRFDAAIGLGGNASEWGEISGVANDVVSSACGNRGGTFGTTPTPAACLRRPAARSCRAV